MRHSRYTFPALSIAALAALTASCGGAGSQPSQEGKAKAAAANHQADPEWVRTR